MFIFEVFTLYSIILLYFIQKLSKNIALYFLSLFWFVRFGAGRLEEPTIQSLWKLAFICILRCRMQWNTLKCDRSRVELSKDWEIMNHGGWRWFLVTMENRALLYWSKIISLHSSPFLAYSVKKWCWYDFWFLRLTCPKNALCLQTSFHCLLPPVKLWVSNKIFLLETYSLRPCLQTCTCLILSLAI